VKKIYFIAVLLVVLGLLVGCGSSSSEEIKEVMVDMEDNGRQINLYSGQTLVVSLEAQPSTGYTWEVVELDELILRQKGDPEFQPASGGIGASGVQIFRFEAVSAGKTDLRMIYHQPWVEGVEPLETFSIHITVL
jgi:inhibitor of cysteine peptidase